MSGEIGEVVDVGVRRLLGGRRRWRLYGSGGSDKWVGRGPVEDILLG